MAHEPSHSAALRRVMKLLDLDICDAIYSVLVLVVEDKAYLVFVTVAAEIGKDSRAVQLEGISVHPQRAGNQQTVVTEISLDDIRKITHEFILGALAEYLIGHALYLHEHCAAIEGAAVVDDVFVAHGTADHSKIVS